jgi:hypothetical protein
MANVLVIGARGSGGILAMVIELFKGAVIEPAAVGVTKTDLCWGSIATTSHGSVDGLSGLFEGGIDMAFKDFMCLANSLGNFLSFLDGVLDSLI